MSRIASVPQSIAMDTMAFLFATNKIEISSTGCWITRTSSVGGNIESYQQVQLQQRVHEESRSRGRALARLYRPAAGFERTRVLVHQLSLLAERGERPGEGQDVSHLCHNANCAAPNHLVIESHDTNMSRQRCQGTLVGLAKCPHDCGQMHPFELSVCTHNPACIVTTRV